MSDSPERNIFSLIALGFLLGSVLLSGTIDGNSSAEYRSSAEILVSTQPQTEPPSAVTPSTGSILSQLPVLPQASINGPSRSEQFILDQPVLPDTFRTDANHSFENQQSVSSKTHSNPYNKLDEPTLRTLIDVSLSHKQSKISGLSAHKRVSGAVRKYYGTSNVTIAELPILSRIIHIIDYRYFHSFLPFLS